MHYVGSGDVGLELRPLLVGTVDQGVTTTRLGSEPPRVAGGACTGDASS